MLKSIEWWPTSKGMVNQTIFQIEITQSCWVQMNLNDTKVAGYRSNWYFKIHDVFGRQCQNLQLKKSWMKIDVNSIAEKLYRILCDEDGDDECKFAPAPDLWSSGNSRCSPVDLKWLCYRSKLSSQWDYLIQRWEPQQTDWIYGPKELPRGTSLKSKLLMECESWKELTVTEPQNES